ncbi:MAG: T9SS type A sorting domain-containing protein [Bacteroidetes bacterium]|nr:T9SS type A sorting domain-containing protein [Bacteroidota bacterium]
MQLSVSTSGKVEIVVYDLFGREVTTIVNETQSAGSHSIYKTLSTLVSGVYLCTLKVNGVSGITEKFIVSR